MLSCSLLSRLWLVELVVLALVACGAASWDSCAESVPMRFRRDVISLTDFGGVGDGRTLNTRAFREAVYRIQHLHRRGGTVLYVPPGVYLTGPFNLTSHMTLFLAKGAVIRASRDTNDWPLIAPLPSYGRGRERPGGRYISLIHGDGLHDVIITGEYGTIDGQGEVWWNTWREGTLKYTRPHLLEFMNSRDIIISNVIFKNSPFWNIHPVYCSDVVIHHVIILAPFDSPNTDGIDPDSSNNVCIEDSYINTGDDLVAIKSGWDEYGMNFGRRSSDITIRRITGTSNSFAGIAFGSETSGGIENILVENIKLYNTSTGIFLKTNAGRGGIVRNITVRDIYMENVKNAIRFAGNVGDHPDNGYNPNALPLVEGVTIVNVWGANVLHPGSLEGVQGSPFRRICLSNINLRGMASYLPWKCESVEGFALGVHPWPCANLIRTHGADFCPTNF